jgi:RNA polymerase sigma factor (sigma-70 family)
MHFNLQSTYLDYRKKKIINEIDAAGVCQDVITELWRVANRFDEELSKESTYVGLLARRRSIDWQRKKSRLPVSHHLLISMINLFKKQTRKFYRSFRNMEITETFTNLDLYIILLSL